MSSRLTWLLAGAAVLPLAAPAAAHAEPYRFHFDHVLGTSLDLVAMAPNETAALMAVSAARAEIDRLDAILSDWRGDAELARLNRGEAGEWSPALVDVLSRCEGWRVTTDGAFDCRVGAPLYLWRDAAARGAPVDASALDRALADAAKDVRIDFGARTVARPDGMGFTVDGMAKGYVIDAALKAARAASPNLKGMMINAGGDLRCWGRAPQDAGWRVGVAGEAADNITPDLALLIGDGAVAASGAGMRDLSVDGCTVSHTLSPATGRPVAQVRHAVVKAPTAEAADALATAFMTMPTDHALALADRMDGVETLITDRDGVRRGSAGWDDLVDRTPRPALIRAAASAAAGADIGYQVPKIEAQPYHAPYVVMWITDENRQLIRTLMVLGIKPRWVPENYIWWRRYGRQMSQPLDSIARPTRLPGRYNLHWDGLDEAGKPVAAGKYILHIEAAREKGGHTYQTVDLDLSGAGTKTLAAKDEMGAVEVRYGPGK